MSRILQFFVRALGAAIIVADLYLAANDTTALEGSWFHMSSFLLILLGLIGVLLLSHQVTRLWGIAKNILVDSPSHIAAQHRYVEENLRGLTDAFYREGAAGLARAASGKAVPMVWQSVLAQVEAKIPPQDIQNLVRYEARRFENELNARIDIVSGLVSLAPSIGMLGTVMGLVKLLSQLKAIEALGPNMALALMTTLYGIGFGVIVMNPLASRLESIRDAQLGCYQQALFWLRLIEERKPSFYCESNFLKAAEK